MAIAMRKRTKKMNLRKETRCRDAAMPVKPLLT